LLRGFSEIYFLGPLPASLDKIVETAAGGPRHVVTDVFSEVAETDEASQDVRRVGVSDGAEEEWGRI